MIRGDRTDRGVGGDRSGRSRRDDRKVWALLVFGVAFAVRAWHLKNLSGHPLAHFLMGDATSYDAWARRIAGGEWVGRDVFYQAPLYPYFLGCLYAWVSDQVAVVRWIQAAVGAGSCALLALAGWRLFGRTAGILAGLLLAVYAPAIFADTTIQKSVLDLFFVCLSLWILAGVVDRPTRGRCLGLGAAIGALVLTRENALIFAVVLVPWLVWRAPGRGAARLLPALLFTGGAALLLLPVALRNLHVGGELHLTTSQLGPNLFIGNNPSADGTYAPLIPGRGDPRYERGDATAIAQSVEGRELSPAEVSRFFVEQVLVFIETEPGTWARLMLRKFALAWNAVEAVDTVDPYTHAEFSPPLRVATWLFHFGSVVPIAILGVFVTWRDRSRLLPLYLLVAAYGASLVAFYVFGRYRLPLVPFAVLFAAAGIAGLRDFVRSGSGASLAVAFTTVAGVAVFSNWPILDRDYMRSITHYNLGNELFRADDLDGADREYRVAIRLREDNAKAVNNLGVVHATRGENDEARRLYERALQLTPDYADARFNLGLLLFQAGELPGAIENFEFGLALDGSRPEMFAELGRMYWEHGEPAVAAVCLEQALRLHPTLPGAAQLLDIVRAEREQQGDDSDAGSVPTACRVPGA